VALAPPSSAVTREQQRHQRELEQQLVITERDERLRLEWAWQFPEDVAAMEAFYAQKEEEQVESTPRVFQVGKCRRMWRHLILVL
jgi:hypothetical protein